MLEHYFRYKVTIAFMKTTNYALITGASSGIGEAIAREYASRGKPTILIARRTARIETLAAELSSQAPSIAITCDLAQPDSITALINELQARQLVVDTLVNNAGYGIPGRYLSVGWKEHVDFLQVMLTGVAELTYRLLPAMEAAGYGRILNVASLAGLVPASAGHTLYGASKAWLIRFSECLAMEMQPRGVHVTALCPGFTYSEFHDANGMRARVSALPRFLWLDAATVARIGIDAVEAGQLRVISGTANKLIAAISKYLPEFLSRALVASKSKQFRDDG